MNMIDKIRELNESVLNAVSGGLSCDSATAIGLIDMCTATALAALGDMTASGRYLGRAEGRLDGACSCQTPK
jgi:hypothetical protein